MVEQAKRSKPGIWTSLSRFEQVALIGSVLIWVGVVLFGAGLYAAYTHLQMGQASFIQGTVIALAATETLTPSPSATTPLFPAGWSTATPTSAPVSTVAAPRLTETAVVDEEPPLLMIEPGTATPAAIAVTATPAAGSASPTPTSTPTPEPEGFPGPASQPPVRLAIPSIGLDARVMPVGWRVVEQNGQQYSVWEVADDAVSWHKTSAYPGHNNNVVLTGHNNIRGEVFRYLIDVEIGAQVFVYADDRIYYYQITEKHILKEKGESADVKRANALWIAPTAEEQVTMVTCWPYKGNSHRLVVVAKPISPPKVRGLDE